MGKTIGVIGSGVAGLTAAYLLSKKYTVHLYEAASYLGGHTNTVSVKNKEGTETSIDTGFIVFNTKNYPLFCRLLDQLEVPSQSSDMSFGFSSMPTGLAYSSDIPFGLFANPKQLFKPRYWRFLKEITRFNRLALQDLDSGALSGQTVGEYCRSRHFSEFFIMSYLIPMGAAIWSASFQETLAYPADHFFLFWKNHCLLQVEGRPEWRTVVNGAQSYVKKIEETVSGSIYLNTPVLGVSRSSTGAKIYLEHDNVDTVDTVVIATHADHAYNLLRDPSDTEKKLLGAWQYSKNKAVLHTDSSIVPAQRRAWASWMVRDFGCSKLEDAVSVTYYMNRLQALESDTDYFVSLNCPVDIQSNSILYECMYQHPIYTKESMATQSKLTTLNTDQTLFCGSYFGYGFHEDAVRSAVTASKSLGVDL